MADHSPHPTRRKVIVAGGAGVTAIGLSGAYIASADTATPTTTPPPSASPSPSPSAPDVLPLTKETTEGPYYLDYDKHRVNITEGRPGTPLELRIQVLNAENGEPVPDASVDIWQCDALGIYSGYAETSEAMNEGELEFEGAIPKLAPDSRTTYLRGFQMTDGSGWVRFRTIVPGWYTGRTVHIHTKVHTRGVPGPGVRRGPDRPHRPGLLPRGPDHRPRHAQPLQRQRPAPHHQRHRLLLHGRHGGRRHAHGHLGPGRPDPAGPRHHQTGRRPGGDQPGPGRQHPATARPLTPDDSLLIAEGDDSLRVLPESVPRHAVHTATGTDSGRSASALREIERRPPEAIPLDAGPPGLAARATRSTASTHHLTPTVRGVGYYLRLPREPRTP
ncbi:hypothetical protein AB0D49_18245 [Streptomyces sp. NPDC048290]|uniref:dioxygenase family protein n=1 Tax=Streptomyces sp. NPDC048290 TaxID=3155811 RepID=UPI0034164ECA